MSIGLELGGWVSPLKYLTEPIANLVIRRQDWNTSDTNYEKIAEEISDFKHIHPKWSTLTFVLMFVPGLLVGLYTFLTKG